jgi:hypothetical protein
MLIINYPTRLCGQERIWAFADPGEIGCLYSSSEDRGAVYIDSTEMMPGGLGRVAKSLVAKLMIDRAQYDP